MKVMEYNRMTKTEEISDFGFWYMKMECFDFNTIKFYVFYTRQLQNINKLKVIKEV